MSVSEWCSVSWREGWERWLFTHFQIMSDSFDRQVYDKGWSFHKMGFSFSRGECTRESESAIWVLFMIIEGRRRKILRKGCRLTSFSLYCSLARRDAPYLSDSHAMTTVYLFLTSQRERSTSGGLQWSRFRVRKKIPWWAYVGPLCRLVLSYVSYRGCRHFQCQIRETRG